MLGELVITAQGPTRYFGRKTVVHDMELSIPRGSVTGLLGLNPLGEPIGPRFSTNPYNFGASFSTHLEHAAYHSIWADFDGIPPTVGIELLEGQASASRTDLHLV